VKRRVVEWTSPDETPYSLPDRSPVAIAIGVFDGVHHGHQVLLDRAVDRARHYPDGRSWVRTFDPNPARVVRPQTYLGDLTTPAQRTERFFEIGIDSVLIVRFSTEFSLLSGYRFLSAIRDFFPELRDVVVGYNFHLGYQRNVHASEASSEMARHGVRVDIVPALKDNEDSISSSRVRRAVAAGELEQAQRLLGRPYAVAVDGSFPRHRRYCNQVLPPPGTYSCTYVGEASHREGMMGIREDGILTWDRCDDAILYVTLRSKADGFDIGTEAGDHR
jgi:riboflavin kinase/FMN adenylyltransferase